jgi:CDP-diacylglycerol---serine O-phosphatidyltransferase
MIRVSRSIVPNLFTVLNIFFGFLCVISSVQHKFILAGMYVVFSGICDTLDGLMARLTNSASDFGVELDSLADVISFGLAPSYLLYELVLKYYGPAGPLLAAAQLIFGALRLARFNVQLVGFHKEYFVGLPIPLSALTLVSYVFFFGPEAISASTTLQWSLIALIGVCGLLMVSVVRYPVLPKISRRSFRERPVQTSGILLLAVAVAVTLGKALFPSLLLIVLSGVAVSARRMLLRVFSRGRDAGRHEQEERTMYT